MDEFKIGDVVKHKTTNDFTMVIMKNCNHEEGHLITKVNPNRFFCKYYNKFTNQWEQKCFYNYELELDQKPSV